MRPQHYQKYLELKNKKLKKQAQQELDLFIASFENFAEKAAWTKFFLENGKYGYRIQYQIYRDIVFPVLYGIISQLPSIHTKTF